MKKKKYDTYLKGVLYIMNRIKRIFLIILSFIFVIVSFWVYLKHEQTQNNKIEVLQNKIEILQTKLTSSDIQWREDSFNYLAIGNSITKHGICDYWWNEVGMAASNSQHDYYHLVFKDLKEKKEVVKSYAVNFSIWETQSADRAETLEVIEPYLDKKLNLVTIQLGENAVDLNTFQKDYVSLINYIKNASPNAQIIIVGDFWNYQERDIMKKEAADSCNVKYVNLDEIKDNSEYQCGLGTVVYDTEGNGHTVEHDGVAKHPNDKGMLYIANAIINSID